MNEPVFILKGNIVYSKNKDELRILKDHYLISESGLVKGVFEKVPPEYAQVSVSDYGECLIIPGLTDLHVHAPQYTFRANEPVQDIEGWTRVSDTVLTKAYSQNGTYSVTVVSNDNQQKEVTYTVAGIDKQAPNVSVKGEGNGDRFRKITGMWKPDIPSHHG